MKKRLICLLVLTALLLSGCGQAAPATEAAMEAPVTEAPTTEAPTTEVPTTEVPTTEAPTTVPTEPPCEHQWSEATYMTASVCELCGEEGAKKPSFFEEHGLNLADAPMEEPGIRTIEAEGTIHSAAAKVSEPDTISITLANWVTIPTRNSPFVADNPNIEEGYQKVWIDLNLKYHPKEYADGTWLGYGGFNFGFYDYYTGAWLHPAKKVINKNGEDIYTYKLEVDGITYSIECTETFNWNHDSGVEQEDGSTIFELSQNCQYRVKVPFDYDGIVLGLIPVQGAYAPHTDENGKLISNLSEEINFEEGAYFRLNGPVDQYMLN